MFIQLFIFKRPYAEIKIMKFYHIQLIHNLSFFSMDYRNISFHLKLFLLKVSTAVKLFRDDISLKLLLVFYMCVIGRADSSRLCSQRWLGDIFVIWGSRARYPHWTTETAQMLCRHIQARAAWRLQHCERAACLWKCCACTCSGSSKIPASGEDRIKCGSSIRELLALFCKLLIWEVYMECK